MKKPRRLIRLKRKVREAEARVNQRIYDRIREMEKDPELMKEIDKEADEMRARGEI